MYLLRSCRFLSSWMWQNCCKTDETFVSGVFSVRLFSIQAIWLGGHRQLAKIDGQRLSSLFPHIAFSTCVRDLGAMLDSELTFSHHVNLIARKCYYQLRQLRVVSRSLTHQS